MWSHPIQSPDIILYLLILPEKCLWIRTSESDHNITNVYNENDWQYKYMHLHQVFQQRRPILANLLFQEGRKFFSIPNMAVDRDPVLVAHLKPLNPYHGYHLLGIAFPLAIFIQKINRKCGQFSHRYHPDSLIVSKQYTSSVKLESKDCTAWVVNPLTNPSIEFSS